MPEFLLLVYLHLGTMPTLSPSFFRMALSHSISIHTFFHQIC
jgi:hypothetical protein